jgi:hypothetical protein
MISLSDNGTDSSADDRPPSAGGFGPSAPRSAPLRFDRREQKFVVDADAVERMLPEIRARLTTDPHGDEDGRYRIITLYFDNAERDVYWERERGVTPRHKLRIRLYAADDASSGVSFLEVKTRLRKRVVKRRMAADVKGALGLCAGDWPERHMEPAALLLLEDVQAMVRSRDLAPACLIGYVRQAWVGPEDLRVTFDSDLVYRARDVEDFADQSADGVLLPESRLVMEVKYPETMPYWLAALLARHGGVMRRFSKYCHAAELSGLVHLPDATRAEAASYFSTARPDAWKPSTAS